MVDSNPATWHPVTELNDPVSDPCSINRIWRGAGSCDGSAPSLDSRGHPIPVQERGCCVRVEGAVRGVACGVQEAGWGSLHTEPEESRPVLQSKLKADLAIDY